MMNITEELRKYGLSEKHAKVYISLLRLGPATVNSIAEDCDLVRTSTYDILKSLREEGIVGSMVKNKIIHFEAADPEKLIQIIEGKKKHIENVIPELKKLKKEVYEIPRSETYIHAEPQDIIHIQAEESCNIIM